MKKVPPRVLDGGALGTLHDLGIPPESALLDKPGRRAVMQAPEQRITHASEYNDFQGHLGSLNAGAQLIRAHLCKETVHEVILALPELHSLTLCTIMSTG